MKKRINTRIRLLSAEYRGAPIHIGLVMSGTKVVASTGNVRNKDVCLCLAEALQTAHRVAQRAQ